MAISLSPRLHFTPKCVDISDFINYLSQINILLMKRLFAISFLMLFIYGINAQPQKFNTILYGVAYYHEYMPDDRLEKDIQLMQDAHNLVGDKTWLRQAQNALMGMLKSAPDTYLRVQTILAKTVGRCISQVKE